MTRSVGSAAVVWCVGQATVTMEPLMAEAESRAVGLGTEGRAPEATCEARTFALIAARAAASANAARRPGGASPPAAGARRMSGPSDAAAAADAAAPGPVGLARDEPH